MSRTARQLACWHGVAVLSFLLAASSAAGLTRTRRPARAPQPVFPSVVGTATAPSANAPYMGVDTWYAFGTNINEQTIVGLTNSILASGLRAAGYRYVWLDGGWWDGSRDVTGNIVVNPAQWPHGIAWLAAYIHAHGLLAGIYTDAGAHGCGGSGAGSYGHYQQDVDAFAAWGFDAVKVDFCGGHALGLDPRAAYGAFAQAIGADVPHRAMMLNVCNPVEPGHLGRVEVDYEHSAFASWSFAPAVATSWRTSFDIGWPAYVPFAGVLHNIDADAAHPEAAGHGHFNDPDYLVPTMGMSGTESQTQFTMWAMLAAPLMLSANPAVLSSSTLQMLEQPEAIAISQDPLGVQGTRVSTSASEVWVKPLAGGEKAVAVLNRSSAVMTPVVPAAAIGLPAASPLVVRDVWRRQTSFRTGGIIVSVPPHGAALLRVALAVSARR